jgi:transaldolase
MKATQLLHDLGQSLWLDNITRDLLNSGTLERYIANAFCGRFRMWKQDCGR